MALISLGDAWAQNPPVPLNPGEPRVRISDMPNPSYPGDPSQDPSQEPTGPPGLPPGVPTPAPRPQAPAPAAPTPTADPNHSVASGPGTDFNDIEGFVASAGKVPQMNPSVTRDPAYWARRIRETGGLRADNWQYWWGRMLEPEGTHQEGPASGAAAPGGTHVFGDPASQYWEQLLNSAVSKLNTPYTPPGFQPMIDQLTNYFKQLQGPAYTPAQMDLIQTQSTDPLMQSRDHARQQILQNFASRGLTPDSPIVQSALEQSDQKYGVANTQAQAGFATNAIGIDRQNAATAAQVGPQIAGLQQGLYTYNLGNQQQGVNLANEVPTTAWNRLTGANSLIQPLNSGQLINQQLYAQGQGYGQSNDYTAILMQLLSQLFR